MEDEEFEMVDYTTSSPWEQFIVSLEAALTSMRATLVHSTASSTTATATTTTRVSSAMPAAFKSAIVRLAIPFEGWTEWELALHRDPRPSHVQESLAPFHDAMGCGVADLDDVSVDAVDDWQRQHRIRLWTGQSCFLTLDRVTPPPVDAPSSAVRASHRSPLIAVDGMARATAVHEGSLEETDSRSLQRAVASTSKVSATAHVLSASEAKLLLSSFAIAAANCKCPWPLFLQSGPKWRDLYCGYACWLEQEWTFNSHHIPYIPHAFETALGVQHLFQAITGSPTAGSFTALASLRATYRIDLMSHRSATGSQSWSRTVPHGDAFGTDYDPLESLFWAVVMLRRPLDDLVTVQGQLDPILSTPLLISVGREQSALSGDQNKNGDALPGLRLYRLLHRVLAAWFIQVDLSHVLPQSIQSSGISFVDVHDVGGLIKPLFVPQPSIRSFPLQAMELSLRMPMGSSVPYRSFLHLFCHRILTTILNPAPSHSHLIPSLHALLKVSWLALLRRVQWHWDHKIPIPNLYSNEIRDESTLHFIYLSSMDDTALWNGKTGSLVDLRFNLIHQKLCLLNYCILRYRKAHGMTPADLTEWRTPPNTPPSRQSRRESTKEPPTGERNETNLESSREPEKGSLIFSTLGQLYPQSAGNVLVNLFDRITDDAAATLVPPPHSGNAQVDADWSWEEDDDENDEAHGSDGSSDEFFDAMEDAKDLPAPLSRTDTIRTEVDDSTTFTSTSAISPRIPAPVPLRPDEADGRLEMLGDAKLWLHPDTPLWVPITQEAGYMTEDMVREMEIIFENLGTSEDAAQIRAKMQSSQLKSDMEAFKAANPGCSLEDFVRWHSPRDLIEDGPDHLSARMTEPKNIWLELWKTTERIPAMKQKPLFDFTQEGQKVIHWMDHLSIVHLLNFCIPLFILSAFEILLNAIKKHKVETYLEDRVEGLAKKLTQLPWESHLPAPISTHDKDVQHRWDSICDWVGIFRDILKDFSSLETAATVAVSLKQKLNWLDDEDVRHKLLSGLLWTCIEDQPRPKNLTALGNGGRLVAVDDKWITIQNRRKLLSGFVGNITDDALESVLASSPVTREYIVEQDIASPTQYQTIHGAYNYLNDVDSVSDDAPRPTYRMYVSCRNGEFRMVECLPKQTLFAEDLFKLRSDADR